MCRRVLKWLLITLLVYGAIGAALEAFGSEEREPLPLRVYETMIEMMAATNMQFVSILQASRAEELAHPGLAAWYDPRTRTIYLTKATATSKHWRAILAHEFAHAQQHQYRWPTNPETVAEHVADLMAVRALEAIGATPAAAWTEYYLLKLAVYQAGVGPGNGHWSGCQELRLFLRSFPARWEQAVLVGRRVVGAVDWHCVPITLADRWPTFIDQTTNPGSPSYRPRPNTGDGQPTTANGQPTIAGYIILIVAGIVWVWISLWVMVWLIVPASERSGGAPPPPAPAPDTPDVSRRGPGPSAPPLAPVPAFVGVRHVGPPPPAPAHAAGVAMPLPITASRYPKLLTALLGDQEKAERLIAYERTFKPGASRDALIDAALDRLQWDNRR